MWLLDRLLTQLVSGPQSQYDADRLPSAIPEVPARRLPLKRTARVGRSGVAPWQKVGGVRRLPH